MEGQPPMDGIVTLIPQYGIAGLLAFVIIYFMRSNREDRSASSKAIAEREAAALKQVANAEAKAVLLIAEFKAEILALKTEVKAVLSELDGERKARWAAEEALADCRQGKPTVHDVTVHLGPQPV